MRSKTILGCDKFMIQFMRGSSSQVQSDNPVLAAGQPFYETDTHKMKVGDGSTVYVDLPYIGDGLAAQYKLDAPTSLSGSADIEQISVSWRSPKDKYVANEGETATSSDEPAAIWDKDVVYRNFNSTPTFSSYDKKWEYTSRNSSLVDTSVTPGTPYYYGVASVSTQGVYSDMTTSSPYVASSRPTLNDYSWSQLSQMAKSGEAASTFKIGDTKSIHLSGSYEFSDVDTTLLVVLVGFNYGKETSKNNMYFVLGKTDAESDNFYGLIGRMYSSDLTYDDLEGYNGGWNSCWGRSSCLGSTSKTSSNSIMSLLPSDLRSVLRSITVYSQNQGTYSWTGSNYQLSNTASATTDYLPLLSEYEVFGRTDSSTPAEANYQSQFEYFKNHTFVPAGIVNSSGRVDANRGSLRSLSYNDSGWCGISTSGEPITVGTSGRYIFCPFFRI